MSDDTQPIRHAERPDTIFAPVTLRTRDGVVLGEARATRYELKIGGGKPGVRIAVTFALEHAATMNLGIIFGGDHVR